MTTPTHAAMATALADRLRRLRFTIERADAHGLRARQHPMPRAAADALAAQVAKLAEAAGWDLSVAPNGAILAGHPASPRPRDVAKLAELDNDVVRFAEAHPYASDDERRRQLRAERVRDAMVPYFGERDAAAAAKCLAERPWLQRANPLEQARLVGSALWPNITTRTATTPLQAFVGAAREAKVRLDDATPADLARLSEEVWVSRPDLADPRGHAARTATVQLSEAKDHVDLLRGLVENKLRATPDLRLQPWEAAVPTALRAVLKDRPDLARLFAMTPEGQVLLNQLVKTLQAGPTGAAGGTSSTTTTLADVIP